MLNQLTEEQKKLMLQVRDEWINLAFNENKKGINKPLFEEGINWLYTDLLKKPKPTIVYCDSWLSCLLTIEVLKKMPNSEKFKLSKRASVGASVRDSVGASVWDSVGASVGASVRDSVRDSVGASVGDSVRDSVGASVGASVRDSVGASVGASVGDSVGASVWASVWDSVWASVGASVGASVRDSVWASVGASFGVYSDYNGWNNFGWVSFYDFFERIKVLDNFKFSQYKKLIRSNCFNAYEFENFVFAIQPPTEIQRDERGRLHNTERPSVEFKDKSRYFFVHGVPIDETTWEKLQNKTYTFSDFVSEQNEEIKSAVLSFFEEKYGNEYLYRFVSENLKEIDTYIDKKNSKYLEGTTKGMNIGVYTLFKGAIGNISLAFVRCYCPSTDRLFFLCVDNSQTKAKDAIASLYRIPAKLKGEIKSIQRQGERYSTVLTEKGKRELSVMTSEEIANLTNISGNEYFKLISYEY